MNPDAKKLLNFLRCPLCKGQLDLLSHTIARGVPQYNFFCVNDYRHYGSIHAEISAMQRLTVGCGGRSSRRERKDRYQELQ